MDIYDQATAREELERERAVAARRPAGPEAVGVCLFCATPVADGRRWCGPECRDDWQARCEAAHG